MTNANSNAAQEVIEDIKESQKLRFFSKAKAIKMIAYVTSNQDEIREYRQNGMKEADITGLVAMMV